MSSGVTQAPASTGSSTYLTPDLDSARPQLFADDARDAVLLHPTEVRELARCLAGRLDEHGGLVERRADATTAALLGVHTAGRIAPAGGFGPAADRR